MKKFLAGIVLLNVISNLALADTSNDQMLFKHSYLNLQMGYGGILSGTSTLPYTVTDHDISSSANVGSVSYRFSGGYLFNITPRLQIGPELGYNGYGDSYYSIAFDGVNNPKAIEYSGHTFDLLANSIYHFNHRWSIGAKLGIASVHQTLHLGNGNYSKSKALSEIGFTGYYQFNKQLGLNFGFLTTLGGSTPDPLANASIVQGSPDNDPELFIPNDSSDVANVGSLFAGLSFQF
jgi:hypothetical protein